MKDENIYCVDSLILGSGDHDGKIIAKVYKLENNEKSGNLESMTLPASQIFKNGISQDTVKLIDWMRNTKDVKLEVNRDEDRYDKIVSANFWN
jgi:hypothetical protein